MDTTHESALITANSCKTADDQATFLTPVLGLHAELRTVSMNLQKLARITVVCQPDADRIINLSIRKNHFI